jgi:hypothetical protein
VNDNDYERRITMKLQCVAALAVIVLMGLAVNEVDAQLCPERCDYTFPANTTSADPLAIAMCCEKLDGGLTPFAYYIGTCDNLGIDGTDCPSSRYWWAEGGGATCGGAIVEGGWQCPVREVERYRNIGLFCLETDGGDVECHYSAAVRDDVMTTVCERCP